MKRGSAIASRRAELAALEAPEASPATGPDSESVQESVESMQCCTKTVQRHRIAAGFARPEGRRAEVSFSKGHHLAG